MFQAARKIRHRAAGRRLVGRGLEILERRDMLSGAPTVVKVEVGSTEWSAAFIENLNSSNTNAFGYAIPLGSNSQSATLTWTNINQIRITFSEDVNVERADLSLSGVNVSAYHFAAFHYDPQKRAATWTLDCALDRDRVRIDLDANGVDPVCDLEGNILDGEWTNNSSVVSGNGTEGGDFQFNFNVLPTDVNNSGVITTYDYLYVLQLAGKTTSDSGYIAKRDIDGNGVIDADDWLEALTRVLQSLPGGSAAGTNNDAPTSMRFDLVHIDNDAIDVAVSLMSNLVDNESSALTYSIVSNSNSDLFDSVTIDSSTKQLVLNAAESAVGRASIVVRATDAGGLFVDTTITVDVNRENLAPEIHDFVIAALGGGVYLVSGRVVDADDDVSNFIINFSNVFETRCAVDENGYFLFAVELPDGTTGIEYAVTSDPHGSTTDIYWREIGLS